MKHIPCTDLDCPECADADLGDIFEGCARCRVCGKRPCAYFQTNIVFGGLDAWCAEHLPAVARALRDTPQAVEGRPGVQ